MVLVWETYKFPLSLLLLFHLSHQLSRPLKICINQLLLKLLVLEHLVNVLKRNRLFSDTFKGATEQSRSCSGCFMEGSWNVSLIIMRKFSELGDHWNVLSVGREQKAVVYLLDFEIFALTQIKQLLFRWIHILATFKRLKALAFGWHYDGYAVDVSQIFLILKIQ